MVINKDLKLSDSHLYYNVGIATANLTLSAQDYGYGCVTLLSTKMNDLATIIDLEDNKKIISVIALGKSDQKIETVTIDNEDTSYYKNGDTHIVPKLSTKALILQKI